MNTTTPTTPPWPNPERRVAKGAGWLAALAVLAIFAPGMLGVDGMHGGFAISFVAFFIAICAVVVVFMFRGRAREADALVEGEDCLAHWTCSGAAWQAYVGDETEHRSANNRGYVWIIVAFAIPIGLLFWLFDHEAGFFVFLTMVGLSLLMAFLGWAIPRIWQAQRRRRGGQVWIGEHAAFYDGALFQWTGAVNRLESVSLEPVQGDVPAMLCLGLRALTRTGWQPYDLRMPVPEASIQEAASLIDILSMQID